MSLLTLGEVEQEWAQSGRMAEFAKKKKGGMRQRVSSRFRKKKQGPSLMGRTLAGKAVRGAAALGAVGGGVALASKMRGSKLPQLTPGTAGRLPGRAGAYGGGRKVGSRAATAVNRAGRRAKAAVGNIGRQARSYGANLGNRVRNNRRRRKGGMLLTGSSYTPSVGATRIDPKPRR